VRKKYGSSGSVIELLGSVFLLSSLLAPAAWASDVVLTFLHSNDFHGRVISGVDFDDPSRGGLARAATLVREIRAQSPNTIFVDSGDLMHGSPVEFMSKGASMIAALNASGVELSIPGNHEFDWGQDNTQSKMEDAHFGWLSANVIDTRSGAPLSPARPYVIRQMGPVKVAFFGLTTLDTVDLEWPPFIDHLKFEDPILTAMKLVPELRSKADIVVALTHLGYAKDNELAVLVPGIDVILGGHSHTLISDRRNLLGVQIAQTGFYGQYLGRLDLRMAYSSFLGRWQVSQVNGEHGNWWATVSPHSAVIPLDASVSPDAAVVAAYEPWWDEWQKLRLTQAGTVQSAVESKGAPGDTSLVRFLADRLREATGSDLTLVDGAWTGEIPAGAFSVETLWNSMGGYTRQNVLRYSVKGSQVLEFLEDYAGKPKKLSVGVSGLTAKVNPAEIFGSKVVSAEIGGHPLNPDAIYTISGVAYVLQEFPSLMTTAPRKLGMPILWSRDLILDRTEKDGVMTPSLDPRLIMPFTALWPGFSGI